FARSFFTSLHYTFFFIDTSTTQFYTLSLHDALPISAPGRVGRLPRVGGERLPAGDGRRAGRHPDPHAHVLQRVQRRHPGGRADGDRKSTRLNSSHVSISYAVFCLKKKNKCYTLSVCS